MLKSVFLQSLLDSLPLCNEKLNLYAITSVLDKMGDYKNTEDFYEDVRIILDATEGKKIRSDYGRV